MTVSKHKTLPSNESWGSYRRLSRERNNKNLKVKIRHTHIIFSVIYAFGYRYNITHIQSTKYTFVRVQHVLLNSTWAQRNNRIIYRDDIICSIIIYRCNSISLQLILSTLYSMYCAKKLLQNLMHQIAGLGIDNRTMCFHPQFCLNFPIKSMIVVFISTCKYQQ